MDDPVNDPVKRCIEFIKAQIRNNRTRQHPVRTAGGSLYFTNSEDRNILDTA